MEGGPVGVKLNDQIGKNLQTKKGVRQGDPLSPILFNIVVDILAILIKRAKAEGQVEGVIPHLVDDGLSILQYANDTILFMDHNLEKARNMKPRLCAFEELSGLKITSIKVKSFVSGRPMIMNRNMNNNLDVRKDCFLLNIWEFRCITESSIIRIGK
jgi:hypothetical protein